jgi:hypothetical protein
LVVAEVVGESGSRRLRQVISVTVGILSSDARIKEPTKPVVPVTRTWWVSLIACGAALAGSGRDEEYLSG